VRIGAEYYLEELDSNRTTMFLNHEVFKMVGEFKLISRELTGLKDALIGQLIIQKIYNRYIIR